MAIAWRRGFFRVWVLLAVVWVVLSGILFWQIYSTRTVDDLYAFIEGQGDVAWRYGSPQYNEATVAKSQGQMQEIVSKDTPYVTIFFKTRADNDFGDVVRHYDPLRIGFYQVKSAEARQSVLMWGLGVTFGVPLAVLAAGWAIAWALSGFRRNPVGGGVV